MARLTLFPVMFSFFVRNDACQRGENKQRFKRQLSFYSIWFFSTEAKITRDMRNVTFGSFNLVPLRGKAWNVTLKLVESIENVFRIHFLLANLRLMIRV